MKMQVFFQKLRATLIEITAFVCFRSRMSSGLSTDEVPLVSGKVFPEVESVDHIAGNLCHCCSHSDA
jgi:hypothetical protein